MFVSIIIECSVNTGLYYYNTKTSSILYHINPPRWLVYACTVTLSIFSEPVPMGKRLSVHIYLLDSILINSTSNTCLHSDYIHCDLSVIV